MTMRTRLLLGALLLLALGLAAEWSLREPAAEAPQATRTLATEVAAPTAPAEASRAVSSAPAVTASTVQPSASEAAVQESVQENDPIEPELPQTPEWKLEKTAHLHTLMGRHVARLEAVRAQAALAGNAAEARRLEVMVQRAQPRLQRLKDEMASLQAQAGAGAAQ